MSFLDYNDDMYNKNEVFWLDPSTGSHFMFVLVTAMATTKMSERWKVMKSNVTVEEWVKRFRDIGLDDTAMQKWHTLFEHENPGGHQSFLEWLGLSADKITDIRAKSI